MAELWVILGVIGAFSGAGFQTYQKILSNDISPIKIAHQSYLIAIPVVIVNLFLLADTYVMPVESFAAAAVASIFNGVSFWLLAEAYKREDLSVISPLRSLIPIMVALIEPLLFPEGYNFWVVLAAVFSTIGIYIVLVEDDYLSPIRGFRRFGVQLGMISTIIIVSVVFINRYALLTYDTSPVTFSFYVVLCTTISTATISFVTTGKSKLIETVTPSLKTIPLGIFRGILTVTYIGSLFLVTGTKTTVLIQSGIVIAIFIGGEFLNEDYFYQRLLGGTIVFLSAVGVALFG